MSDGLIRILFFGQLADFVSEPEISIAATQNLSAQGLYQQLCVDNQQLPTDIERINVAVNQELQPWDSLLKPGDEVAFLPPVTGG